MLEQPESSMPRSGKVMEIGQSAGKSFAYVLGVYLGDGCVTNVQGYDRFRLNTIDRDFAEATAKAIGAISAYRPIINGPYQDKRFTKSRPYYCLYCGDRALCRRLKDETQSKARIPGWMFDAQRDVQLAFVAGLMDSEGYVTDGKSTWTNRRFYMGFKCCDGWIMDFARLLEHLGVRLSVSREKPRKEGYKAPTLLRIKMQSWIDAGGYFTCARKQNRVNEWASLPAYFMRGQRLASETARQTAICG